MTKNVIEVQKLIKKIGQNIKIIREQKGMTIEELANRTGFSQNYINSLENGKLNDTTTGRIEIIAKVLGVKMTVLF